jgi:hypothetical protein
LEHRPLDLGHLDHFVFTLLIDLEHRPLDLGHLGHFV